MSEAIDLARPWALLLMPLVLLPLWHSSLAPRPLASLDRLPPDPASTALALALRLIGALAVAAIVAALAEPWRAERQVERIGRGAEIVLLLDRSRSMDQLFIARGDAGNFSDSRREAKGRIARRILADFAARRGDDRFAMVAFSTLAMPILDFSRKPEVIQAAIAAGEVGRGLGETDIARGLEAAAALFDDRPYNGSRIVLMVSDGGAHIDPDTRERLARKLRAARIALYWIYIRSYRSPGLMAERDTPPEYADTVPEYFLHRYFREVGIPYRAYEAENPDDLKRAVADVDRLESLPIATVDSLPRQDLAPGCYAVALGCVVLLLGARLLEIRR